jgi:hypothetical protein
MDTLTLPHTRWTCETTARGAYDSRAFDVRHGAVLFNHGRYTEVGIDGWGDVVFTLADGRVRTLRPSDVVHLSLLHTPA